MTLATRCSACGTSFRVVQDQLKVSGGWVRCGRCNEVFNALEGLYEIYTQPGELPASAPARGPGNNISAPAGAPESTARTTERAGATTAEAQTPIPPPVAPQSPYSAGAYAGSVDEGSPSWRAGSQAGPTAAERTPEELEAYGDERAAHAFDDVETRLEPRPGEEIEPTPSFMQSDATVEPRPPMGAAQRALWVAGGVLLGVLLVLQLGLAWRDTLAAHSPEFRPVLRTLCALAGCQVEPLRRMAALSVEGSNLRQKSGDGNYELMVNLRNRGDLGLMLPAFELTLTDTQGQALIRRVLTPRDMGARSDTIAGGGELSLLAALDIPDRRIAGYTVEIFYP
jgi:predicted Zn finger-like uncharacterized protein